MAVAVPIVSSDVRTGPGKIYYALLGAEMPAMTVANGVFTDLWPAAWLPVGPTESGFQTSHGVETEGVEVEESLVAIRQETTSRTDGVAFEMAHDTIPTLLLALNGGTVETTGTGATTLNKFSPATIGNERRVMIGWEHDSNKTREIFYKCFNTANVERQRRKGNVKTTYSCEFSLELPDTTVASVTWNLWDTRVLAA